MTLAQENSFRAKNPFRKKLAWEIPTRDYEAAERAAQSLRDQFNNSSKAEQKEIAQLMFDASRVLMQMAKNKRKFTKAEQTQFARLMIFYSRLKSEFQRELK